MLNIAAFHFALSLAVADEVHLLQIESIVNSKSLPLSLPNQRVLVNIPSSDIVKQGSLFQMLLVFSVNFRNRLLIFSRFLVNPFKI